MRYKLFNNLKLFLKIIMSGEMIKCINIYQKHGEKYGGHLA